MFVATGGGPLSDLFVSMDVHSDTPVFGMISELKKWYSDAGFVATWRSKETW